MGKVIDRIRAKVTRAKHHIQDFQLALSAFRDTNPCAVGIKEDAQAGKRIYYVSKADPVPDELAAIAADAIQNLRSALEHIAYQLVLDARGGAKPDWRVSYPISGSAVDYPAARRGRIKGVRQEVIDAIDATEPYKGGKGHALWQLNKLTQPDKHQLLVVAGTFFGGVDISADLNVMMREMLRKMGEEHSDIDLFKPLFLQPADKLLSLKGGDELYIEPIDHEVAKDRRFTFDISFNEPSVIECQPALKTLQDMTNLVDEVITKLGRFLP